MIHTELILTGKPVSSSYQNLLQFSGSGVTSTLVKADGNDFDYTASVSITSSYSVSSSWAPGSATYTSSLYGTASWAVNAVNGGTLLTTGSTYPFTASWANNSISASYVSGAYSYINNLSSSTITVNNGAKIGGMSGGITSVDTVQIGATDVGIPLPDASYKRDGAVQIGWGAGQSAITASNAVAIGIQAGTNTKLANNATQIGVLAGANTTTASSAVQIGVSAGQNSTDATSAVQIGNTAGGNSNTAINAVQVGAFAGLYARTGSYTTFIGSGTDALEQSLNVEKSIAIGYNAKVSGSKMAVIGGTGADAVSVGIGTTSPQNTLEVVGNIYASSVTASLSGTASWAVSASYAMNGGGTGVVDGGSYNISASWASSSLSASYVSESVMGKSVYQIQYITSASYAALSPPVATTVYIIKDLVSTITIVSASWAETASFALNGGTVGSFMNSNNPTFTGTMTQNTGGAFEIDIAGNIKTAGTIIATGSITSLGGFVGTASWATNALTASVMAPSLPYVTIATSSANWITCSFLDTDEYVNIATGSVTYNFTCSNLPASSMTSNLTLFLNNTITGTNTASLSFPANWSFVGLAPTYITASKHAVLNLKAWGTSNIAAAWNPQY